MNVAGIFDEAKSLLYEQVHYHMMLAFADLFAADDLEGVYCGYCGDKTEETECLDSLNLKKPKHSWVYHNGFNEASRELFLAACGLEPESRVPLPGPNADGVVPGEGDNR